MLEMTKLIPQLLRHYQVCIKQAPEMHSFSSAV
jgi:hypothetical protein